MFFFVPRSSLSQGGKENTVAMFTYLVDSYLNSTDGLGLAAPARPPPPPIETPPLGCVHPDFEGGSVYIESPADYMRCVAFTIETCL